MFRMLHILQYYKQHSCIKFYTLFSHSSGYPLPPKLLHQKVPIYGCPSISGEVWFQDPCRHQNLRCSSLLQLVFRIQGFRIREFNQQQIMVGWIHGRKTHGYGGPTLFGKLISKESTSTYVCTYSEWEDLFSHKFANTKKKVLTGIVFKSYYPHPIFGLPLTLSRIF